MADYIPKEISSLVSARISPLTAKAICHLTDLDKVARLMANAPDDVRHAVENELSDLRKAASLSHELTSTQRTEAWISVCQAATILNKTDRTVRNYIKNGLLDSRKRNMRSFEVSRLSVEIMRRKIL